MESTQRFLFPAETDVLVPVFSQSTDVVVVNFVMVLKFPTTILEARRILRVVSHFNLSVLTTETLSVSLCREIDNVFGAIRTCFDHVLSKFSGFSWERILFLKSACVNMVMQIQVQIGDSRRVYL